ncbi:MAG: DUF1289 domain-containing protein [Granulosicoccus sp.]|nr:DUF1289 domain-containing protein [Granulosicoccus sp.]
MKRPLDRNKSSVDPGNEPAADPVNTRRRRRRQRRVPDSTVPSPCIAVCQYNENNLCAGCLRTPDEIRDWIIMSREEKLAVLASIETRA